MINTVWYNVPADITVTKLFNSLRRSEKSTVAADFYKTDTYQPKKSSAVFLQPECFSPSTPSWIHVISHGWPPTAHAQNMLDYPQT